MAESVLEFLEKAKKSDLLPKITVTRSKDSKYLFLMLARAYRRILGITPQFYSYSKQDVPSIKGLIEEHSLFTKETIYVLDGFSKKFVEELDLPPRNYVVAETDEGEYTAPPYSYAIKKLALKVMMKEIGVKLQHRKVAAMDWSMTRGYVEIEQLLRRAKILGWTEQELEEHLQKRKIEFLLVQLKRGKYESIWDMRKKYGDKWVYRHITDMLTKVEVYRVLKQMRRPDDAIAQHLGVSRFSLRELQETAKTLDSRDIHHMVDWLLFMDSLVLGGKDLEFDLFLLGNPIQVSR